MYLRKSKGKAGITRQRKENRAYADRIGWRIVAEFAEPDTTAFAKIGEEDAPRPEFDKMIEFLGRDDRNPPLGILAWHVDRLSRNSGEVRPFAAVCVKGGHLVDTPRCGSYDLSLPNNRKRFRDDVSDAEGEVDHMIERIDAHKAEAAAEGRWLGGRRPFGFKKDGTRHRRSEAAAIAKACKDVLAGTSLASIAREWNAAELRTSGGNEWDPTEVRRVLLRARNAGLMVWRGEIVGKASWDPIVKERQWRAMVRVLEDPARRSTPGPERRWLGSGLYVCGVCEQARLRVGTANGGYPTYRCRGQGVHVSRAAGPLDEYVGEHVVGRLSRPDARDLLMDDDRADREELEARLLELRAELQEAESTPARSVREARKLAEVADLLAAEITEVEGKLIRPDRAAILRHLIEADDVGEAWLETPLDRQQAVLRALFTVTIHPAPKGRPPGWKPGQPYFHAESVAVEPV
ncbi:hypothetical protein GCM10023196_036220 [Actinoallomurus vinaceus]|uniref:Recombinase domain-containing protein n=1 Tax=Actinoallomurus vinaceus TaxID=1080074 RepID=A0ABP8UBT6_9ACTN